MAIFIPQKSSSGGPKIMQFGSSKGNPSLEKNMKTTFLLNPKK